MGRFNHLLMNEEKERKEDNQNESNLEKNDKQNESKPEYSKQISLQPGDAMVSLYNDTKQPRHHDTITSYNDTKQPRHHDTITSRDITEKIRSAVKQLGKEAATHRFTEEEKRALASIQFEFMNRGLRTSENQLTRIAVHFLLEDYYLYKEKSFLLRVLESLNK